MQQPLQTGNTARTTTDEVIQNINLSGKTIIITGGAAGLGLETTKTLAKAGATIIIPVRNPAKAQESLARMSNIELYPASFDLSNRDTIKAFTQWFQKKYQKLDILINSAGIMATPLSRDSFGNELQIATNYLGHFFLTKALLPELKNANGARVVYLTSRAHWFSPFHFEDPNFIDTPYDKWTAYGQSKTAVSLLSVALDELYKKDNIRSFAVHPGSIVTNLSHNLTDDELSEMGAINKNGERGYDSYTNEHKTIKEGAATIVWCAVSQQLAGYGGVYCENGDIAPIATDDTDRIGVKPWAIDKEAALTLWEETPLLFK
ncbi:MULTISPECIES: SDR family NAD(P)-dependent oxidoreductase [unclassified Bacillus (in: firmicutes)]|uniref:SDR family NAD(P)-dependent oxidoreductase n=1 Tax=unclassified Bacillus (in: firmicutes) TaxID=185979 RepID=UPI0004E0E2D2|nr:MULTISPECIES: SDR family NAD(P)-dependent oxidoreductase [unclassified Bacillus (in: firmicutes)]